MRIERFRIQGFKSLADVTVEGLSDINVFFGLNDVGKSNIFEALALWQWCLTKLSQLSDVIDPQTFAECFGDSVFQLAGQREIVIEVEIISNSGDNHVSRVKL